MKLLLDMIQPSQLYISQLKLDKLLKIVEDNGIESLDPIPIKELNDEIVATDGHTRLFLHHMFDIEEISVVWDEDDLDWEMYRICVEWCHDNDIYAIQHLEDRILDHDQYQELWIDRCQNLKTELNYKRSKGAVK